MNKIKNSVVQPSVKSDSKTPDPPSSEVWYYDAEVSNEEVQKELKSERKTPNLVLSAFLVISIPIMVQLIAFKKSEASTSIQVSMIAFAFSIPILAICVFHSTIPSVANREAKRLTWRYEIPSIIGILGAIVGIATATWHITHLAVAGLIVGGIIATVVQWTSYKLYNS